MRIECIEDGRGGEGAYICSSLDVEVKSDCRDDYVEEIACRKFSVWLKERWG